jgi:hypothetical protein
MYKKIPGTDIPTNPMIAYVLCLRGMGWKHSQIPWSEVRKGYEYMEQTDWDAENAPDMDLRRVR